MHTFKPTFATFLFQGATSEIQPRLVEVIALFVQTGRPDENLTGIGQGAVFQFTFGKCCIRPLALGKCGLDSLALRACGIRPLAFGDIAEHDSADGRPTLDLLGYGCF